VAAHQLAQVNIGRTLGPMDSEVMAEFAAALDPVNAIADAAPGFVWRLQDGDGNATSIHVFEDERMLINMSVWTSLDALANFVMHTEHRDYLRRRREWFERIGPPIVALWWVPAGHVPTPDEAKGRLDHLAEHGPTPHAFTFRHAFPPPTVDIEVEVGRADG
jgi:heme-degrading monooxygenase HmoA